METRYLKTLSVVIEYGSFSKAATELNITQSAVSQRIRFLEDTYGHPLVERTGHSVKATDAGMLVNARAAQILLIEKDLESELKGIGNRGRLSLCSTPTFGIVYFPKALNRFLLAHSSDVDLKFMLNTPELSLKGLIENEFDIAVIEHYGPLNSEYAEIHPLPPDELTFISAASLALPQPLITVDDLLKQRLIARRVGCSSRCLLQENLKRCEKSIDDFSGMIIYDDLHLTIQTVRAGQGVAFVSKSLVSDLIQSGELIGHNVDGFHCSRSRSIIINKKRPNDPIVTDFIGCVRAVFDS